MILICFFFKYVLSCFSAPSLVKNMTAVNSIKTVQTTTFVSTMRKIITPKPTTIAAEETRKTITNESTTGAISTQILQTTSEPRTVKPVVSKQVSTESVLPTIGVKVELCRVHTEDKNITDEAGCFSTQPVRQTSCQGFCNSRAVANVTSPLIYVECFCCKPKNLSVASVPMKCAGGGLNVFKYVVITECSCVSCESIAYEAKLGT